MKYLSFALFFFLLGNGPALSQTPLTDDIDVGSNTQLNLMPGQYQLPDAGGDGLIRVVGQSNIVIDGAGVEVDGQNFTGNLIRIDSAQNVVIRNFKGGRGFYYAVYVTNSRNIVLENCRFDWNRVDSIGWISIWTDIDQSLGGGALFSRCDSVLVQNDTMQFQNDGVALYHCKHVEVRDCNFSWNTSFGVRMYFTDSSSIHHNNCSHVNRPYTNPSDCAALLMLVSNENRVEHNDLSYSGDGVFLGQYEHSDVPNNNYFAYNECSFSPHNAIEATFADGNVYKHNKCNNSHYGLWLGYSFNSVVDSNEIVGNQYSGIAVDRGFNNAITNNLIQRNPTGIELWEGAPIAAYAFQTSHDYHIEGNRFVGNTVAVSAISTEKTRILFNDFDYNRTGIFLDGIVSQDTISGNHFRGTSVFHIENQSAGNVYAPANIFTGNSLERVNRKIFDDADDQALGQVLLDPIITSPEELQTNPTFDLAEPPARWEVYGEANWGYGLSEPTTVSWDTDLKKAGTASIHLRTGNGWYTALAPHPGGDSLAQWSLTALDTLHMWLRTNRQIPYGFQFFHLRLGNDYGGWYEYAAPVSLLNNAHLSWKNYHVPLAGNATWVRTAHGEVSLDDINYVEIWADTWDFGFDLWVDGLRFGYAASPASEPGTGRPALSVYPNPASTETTVFFQLPARLDAAFELTDALGRMVWTRPAATWEAGENRMDVPVKALGKGIYLLRMQTEAGTLVRKLMVN
jgi:parallel beta-helix repeat protein